MAAQKKGGLGRGLDALFADVPVKAPEETKNSSQNSADDDQDKVKYIKIHDIMPNANQPRKTFNEEAEGLRQMTETFGMTQEQVSKSVGKSRPYITNSMRLLKLPDYIKESIADGIISAGHGRTLVAIEEENSRKQLWNKIIEEGLSVRETEKIAAGSTGKKKRRRAIKEKNPDLVHVENELKDIFGTKVNISKSGKKGKIEIEYYSPDELNRLIELLKTLT